MRLPEYILHAFELPNRRIHEMALSPTNRTVGNGDAFILCTMTGEVITTGNEEVLVTLGGTHDCVLCTMTGEILAANNGDLFKTVRKTNNL